MIRSSIDTLKELTADMSDAVFVERRTADDHVITLVYIKSLIDGKRLNEAVVQPLIQGTPGQPPHNVITHAKVKAVSGMEAAVKAMMVGSVLIVDPERGEWWSVKLPNDLGRAVEQSETETILYGPKDSFTEQLDQNLTMIRRRLPLTELKSESFTAGYLSQTSVEMLYVQGLTNPELIAIARRKLEAIDFDVILDSSQVEIFMEDHNNSVFPQFLQTDRPDQCAYWLSQGKLVFLVNNTPFALVAPTTFFHLFKSPEDYIHRWIVASFLRILRYFGYFMSMMLIPVYVALTTHHYQMIPLPLMYVLLESRSKLPFTPFWEGLLMVLTLEIIKEASLRLPSKTSQTLGVIGGIVIGQAAVEAGFASKILIVLLGISGIASFLVPNYLLSKANTVMQLILLLLAAPLGLFGIALGMIGVLAHLNGLTSLKQPYFAPVTPFFPEDWKDLFVRANLHWMKERPQHLNPLKKWRFSSSRRR